MQRESVYLSCALMGVTPLLLAGCPLDGEPVVATTSIPGTSTDEAPTGGDFPTTSVTGTTSIAAESSSSDATTSASDPTTTDPTGGMSEVVLDESLLVRVYDPEGEPIPDAVLVSRRITYKATPDGAILVRKARPSVNQNVFVGLLSAPGYTTMSIVAEIPKDHPVARRAVLKPLGPPKPVSIADGGWAKHEGVAIYFPPNAIVDSAGLPVAGNIDVSITPYLSGTDDRDAVPAPMLGKDAEGNVFNLVSAGMFEVNLTQQGKPVKLRDGVAANLEVELPVSLYDQVSIGEPIPAWTLDPKIGIWSGEGPGYVQLRQSDEKLVWRAEAPHFSVYNVDWPVVDSRCMELEIVNSANDPYVGMATYVKYLGIQVPKGPVYAGNDGKVCLEIPTSWGNATVTVGIDKQTPIAEPVEFFADPNSPPSICTPYLASNFGKPWSPIPQDFMPAPCEQRKIQVYDNPKCTPGSYSVCNPLPPDVDPIGICADGLQICNEYGTGWLQCAPAMLPMQSDDCNQGFALDDDCDGDIDEDCVGEQGICDPDQDNPAETKGCYTHKPSDLAVTDDNIELSDQEQLDMFGFYKTCKLGTQTCNTEPPDEGEFGACLGSITPSMETCETFDIDENCDGRPTCDLSTSRAGRAGSNMYDHFATAIAVDSGQNAFVASTFKGHTMEYNPNAPMGACYFTAADDDVILYRVPAGDAVCAGWAHELGGTGEQRVTGLAVDADDNVVVAGWFTQSLDIDNNGNCPALPGGTDRRGLLARYTFNSSCAWRKAIGSVNSKVELTAVVTDTPALDIYVLGQVEGPLATDGPNCPELPGVDAGTDIFLGRYNKNGLCTKRIRIQSPDPNEDEKPRQLTFNASGTELWFTGSFQSKIDLEMSYMFNNSSQRIFVAKIDKQLDGIDKSRTWAETADPGAYHTVAGLAALENGSMALAGTYGVAIDFAPNDKRPSKGESDIYTAVLTSNMTLVTARNYGTQFTETVSAVASAVDLDGAPYFVFAGNITGAGLDLETGELLHSNGKDIFVARALGSNGKVMDARVFHDVNGGDQIANAIAVHPTGYVYLAGQMQQGSLKFAGPQDPQDQYLLINPDIFVDTIFAVLSP